MGPPCPEGVFSCVTAYIADRQKNKEKNRMKKKPLHRISSLLAATVLGLFLLTGCAG